MTLNLLKAAAFLVYINELATPDVLHANWITESRLCRCQRQVDVLNMFLLPCGPDLFKT